MCLFISTAKLDKVRPILYKIPGGKKVRLNDEEAILVFDTYYPDWDKNFYMVPPYLSRRNTLFGSDKGYTGQAEIADAFYRTMRSGILISNFSDKDKNNILQRKSKTAFRCDFIFITKNHGLWIIEVGKCEPQRINCTIREKFVQAIKHRNHILQLSEELFGKEFANVLGNICNCVVAIPDASAIDFKKFKETQCWRSFRSDNPGYKIKFIGMGSPVADFDWNDDSHTSLHSTVVTASLRQFYTCLALVKTRHLAFDSEQFLSKNEKKVISNVTSRMHPSEYHVILSPEQWSILDELPSHLQIIGEAATGKTELLKALMFKILKYNSKWGVLFESGMFSRNMSNIAEGVGRILYVIFGNRPYLRLNIESFIALVMAKLRFPRDLKPSIQMISECSAEKIEDQLLKILECEENLRNTVVLIDECYHGITNMELLKKLKSCRGCWMTAILTGQNPLGLSSVHRLLPGWFQKRILRRLYRGTKGITMAASTLRLASFSDFPLYLANQFSCIERCDTIKLENIDQIAIMLKETSTFVTVIKEATIKEDSSAVHMKFDSLETRVNEEFIFYGTETNKGYMYNVRCSGAEFNSVWVIIPFSLETFSMNCDVIFQLLSMYISRAVSSCVVYCNHELQESFQNKLFPRRTVQLFRSVTDFNWGYFPYEEINSDLKAINPNLDLLSVAVGAAINNEYLLSKLLEMATQEELHQALYIMITNPPPLEKVTIHTIFGLHKAAVDVNLQDKDGSTLLIHATENGHLEITKYLIEANANVNLQRNDGTTALMFAAQIGAIEMAKYLIEANAYVNLQRNDGSTALMFAAQIGAIKMATYLIEANANVNLQRNDGSTALMFAAQIGAIKMATYLIEANANVNLQRNDGSTALMFAAQIGAIEMVKYLVEANANVNIKRNDESTALMFAAQIEAFEIARYLIEANANVDLQRNDGSTTLMFAAQIGAIEMVKYLVEANANVNIKRNDESTALMFAAQIEAFEIARYLIEANANVDLQRNDGSTVLMFAVQIGAIEIARYLIEANANVNLQRKDGSTALMFAAQIGTIEMAKYLIEADANVNLQRNDGSTALMFAAQSGAIEMAKYLIEANANVNLQRKDGSTALMFAAQIGAIEMAKYLIEANANVNLQRKDGSTALMFAAQIGAIEISRYLIWANANVNLQRNDQSTAVTFAVQKGAVEIARVLMQANADTRHEDVGIACSLIKADANVNLCLPLCLDGNCARQKTEMVLNGDGNYGRQNTDKIEANASINHQSNDFGAIPVFDRLQRSSGVASDKCNAWTDDKILDGDRNTTLISTAKETSQNAQNEMEGEYIEAEDVVENTEDGNASIVVNSYSRHLEFNQVLMEIEVNLYLFLE